MTPSSIFPAALVILRASDEDARRISTFAPVTSEVGSTNFLRLIAEVAT